MIDDLVKYQINFNSKNIGADIDKVSVFTF